MNTGHIDFQLSEFLFNALDHSLLVKHPEESANPLDYRFASQKHIPCYVQVWRKRQVLINVVPGA